MIDTTLVSWAVENMPESEYHAHPALSSSGARTLLKSPAKYAYERTHPRTPTREMQLGTCVHTAVFGTGQRWDVLPGDDLRVKGTKDFAARLEERGEIALKPAEFEAVRGMTGALLRHPVAGPLLANGVAERSLFWTDEATGVPCRARLDWMPEGRNLIVDLKTTGDASPAAIAKHVVNFGYHVQAFWYLDAVAACGLGDSETGFAFVFVEREPPHLVTVAELDGDAFYFGAEQARRAREIYRDCTASGQWPGYPDIVTVRLPPWARRTEENYE